MIPAEKVDAFPFLVESNQPAYCANLYLATAIPDANVLFGVYSDDPGSRPAKLLSKALLIQAKLGWNRTALDLGIRAPVGTRLWIAIVPDKLNVSVAIDTTGCSIGRRSNESGYALNGSPAVLPVDWNGTNPDGNANHCNVLAYVSP